MANFPSYLTSGITIFAVPVRAFFLKHTTVKILILFALLPAFGSSQNRARYGGGDCDKIVYPMFEISAEAGASTGLNFAFGITSHDFPLSAHMLLNITPSETADKSGNGSSDMEVNPMLMLRLPFLHFDDNRHNIEGMVAGGTTSYRAGLRYFYTFGGQGNLFIQPMVTNRGYVTNFGVAVVL